MSRKLIVFACLLAVSQASIIHRRPRIIGRHDAEPGEFPHQVSLQMKLQDNYTHFCGGTIINEYWILTAVHCLQFLDLKLAAHGGAVRVVAGKHDLNATEPSEQRVYIKETFRHKNYRGFLSSGPNDIALIRLTAPLKFKDRVAPVHLPKKNAELPTGAVIVSGWGAITDDGTLDGQEMPNILQKAEFEIIDLVTCRRAIAKVAKAKGLEIDERVWEEKVTETSICTGPLTGGSSPCSRDSGGPLISKDDNGESELIGIVSWVMDPCAVKEGPSAVFVRVSSFIDWIEKTMSNSNNDI